MSAQPLQTDIARTAVLAHQQLALDLHLRMHGTGNAGLPLPGWSHVPDKGVCRL